MKQRNKIWLFFVKFCIYQQIFWFKVIEDTFSAYNFNYLKIQPKYNQLKYFT